jgi:glycosyltransferase involved in cell wall biosynthesis
MKIVSTTLSSNNANIIREALESIRDHVDECIIIDTGITDNSLEIAREVVGDKLIVVKYKWVEDFADARNFALDAAFQRGADWAITVDTDERIILDKFDLRAFCTTADKNVYLMPYKDGFYCKERIFKFPIVGQYAGPTHEAFINSPSTDKTPGGSFWELGKDEAGTIKKFARDIKILEQHTKKNPSDPRWFYYLGESYRNSTFYVKDLSESRELYKKAIKSFDKCWSLNGWDEESAYAAYKAAICYTDIGDYQSAIESCARGIARHPAIPELFWYAGYCSYHLGRYEKAIHYSRLAVVLGIEEGIGKSVYRVGFRHLPASYDGPYDIMYWSYKKLGREEEANAALVRCQELLKIRESL